MKTREIQDNRLISAVEVAEILGVSRRTIWRLVSKASGGGSFPQPVRPAPQVTRWRYQDILDYIRKI